MAMRHSLVWNNKKEMGDGLFKIEILLQGIGILMAWNVILASFDFFNAEFSGDNPSFIFPILNNGTSIIIQPLIVLYGHKFSYTKRITISYAIIAAMLVISPLFSHFLGGSIGFPIMCIVILVMGMSNVVCQTTAFAMAGTLPDEYTNYVMIGNGVVGVFVDLLRLICLASFPQDRTGYFISTLVYFVIAAAVLIICIFAQIHLIKNPLMIESLAKTGAKIAGARKDEELRYVEDEQPVDDKTSKLLSTVPVAPIKQIDNKLLLSKIWQPLFLVWLCYVITFGMLSGVALATSIPEMPYSYFSTLMVTTFNIFDFLGRSTPRFYILSIRMLWIIVLARFVTWVTFILIASDDPSISPAWLFSYAWFKFVNMAIFAYTNGFTSTCAMILGPAQVEGYMKAKAGSLMSMGLLYGIVSGSLVALAFTNVGHIPS